MKNIFAVFVTDYKRIKTNVVAIVVILGLTVLPCLYAWFNILSNWDPYGPEATSRLKVAVASDDVGANIEDAYFNMGDSVVEALQSNTTIGWVFTDTTQEAIDGVYSGEYYAALVIPENFTEGFVSVLTQDIEHPEIIYYENEKKNAIAPKITGKAKTAVQRQVNATFISTLAETLTKVSGTVMNSDSASELGITDAGSLVDVLIEKLNSVMTEVESFETLVDSFIMITESVSATSDVAGESTTAEDAIKNGQSAISQAQGALNNGIVGKLGIAQSLSASLSSMQSLLKSVSSTYADMQEDLAQFNASMETMGINLHETKDLITDMKSQLQDTVDTLTELRDGDGYQVLMELLSTDPDTIGSFMSAPVEIETEAIYPIDYYGSAMSPFYSVLAIWVGSLILVAIIHVGVKPLPGVGKVKAAESYVGRYLTFFLIGQAQALLTVLGDLYYVGIQCLHPFKFWLAASMASFVFTLLIYSLTVAFGNIGEALAVVIMVIQVAGAGGTFPVQTLPQIYQDIYQFLPFPYAMDAMRECVAGMYDHYYWECIGKLALYIPVSVVIGLICGKPFVKMNERIEENKEDSGVMV